MNTPPDKNIPAVLLDELSRMDSYFSVDNYHGAIFGIKDTYELTLKLVCCGVCAWMQSGDDDSFCGILLDPEKSLSFGDWCNDVLTLVRKSKYVSARTTLRTFLKKLGKFYQDSNIVSWRNETLGHGLMHVSLSPQDQQEIEDKASRLRKHFDETPWPPELFPLEENNQLFLSDGNETVPLEPFLLLEQGHILLFDSLNRNGFARYLDLTDRCRVIRSDQAYWTERQKKYFGELQAKQTRSLTAPVYLSDQDAVLNAFHLVSDYMRPDYMTAWVERCLTEYSSGVFLLQGEQNTGKSSFVCACDELSGHGKQKISFSDTSIRAYYCSRTDITLANDFVSRIDDLLRELPDGRWFRSRTERMLPSVCDLGMAEALAAYRHHYETEVGTEKLVLMIDGIDELHPRCQGILDRIPPSDALSEGVFLFLTCRSEEQEISPAIVDFLNAYRFTDRIRFAAEQENRALLIRYLTERCHLDSEKAETAATSMGNKLHMLPLIACLPSDGLENLISGGAMQVEALAEQYLQRIALRYGSSLYNEFEEFLAVLAHVPEPITLSEIAYLLNHVSVTERLLCFVKDASPLLAEFRSYRGNVFGFSQQNLLQWSRERNRPALTRCTSRWVAQLLSLENSQAHIITEDELDGRLLMVYALASSGQLQDKETIKRLLRETGCLTSAVDTMLKRHQIAWAIQDMDIIIGTMEQMEIPDDFGQGERETLLITVQTQMNLYYALRRFEACTEMLRRAFNIIEQFPDDVWSDADRFNLAVIAQRAMSVYGEQYDVDAALEWYCSSQKTIESIHTENPQLTERIEGLKTALDTNLIGVLRNKDPERIVPVVERIRRIAEESLHRYGDVRRMLMVAMAYKSIGRFVDAEQVLTEATDWIVELDRQGVPRDTELVFQVSWKRCQCISERHRTGGEASIAEVVGAINVMDTLIDQTIAGEQGGISMMTQWKADFMTTGMTLRGVKAMILSHAGCGVNDPDFQSTMCECFRAAEIILTLYDNMDRAAYQYDRPSAIINQMNCAAIYAEFRWYDRAEELLSALIDRYEPSNYAEAQSCDIVRRKLEEIQTMHQNDPRGKIELTEECGDA